MCYVYNLNTWLIYNKIKLFYESIIFSALFSPYRWSIKLSHLVGRGVVQFSKSLQLHFSCWSDNSQSVDLLTWILIWKSLKLQQYHLKFLVSCYLHRSYSKVFLIRWGFLCTISTPREYRIRDVSHVYNLYTVYALQSLQSKFLFWIKIV